MKKILQFSIKNSAFMKKTTLFLCIIFCASFFIHCSRTNNQKISKYELQSLDKAVFFSDPAGHGIRLLQPESGNISALTNNNDDFPFYSQIDQTLYFIRIETTEGIESKKSIRRAAIVSKDLSSGNEKKLSEMLFYIPRQDRKDQIFFVDNGAKLLVSPIDQECFLLDSFTGQKLPELNPVDYFSQINQYDSALENMYGVVDTDSYNPFLSNVDNVEDVPFGKVLFTWNKSTAVQPIKQFLNEESFDNWFYGFSFSQNTNALYYSSNQILYRFKDDAHASISPGVHPFTVKAHVNTAPIYTFPFFRLFRIVTLDQNTFLFTENNHLALFSEKSFHFINNNEFLGGQTRPYDPYYLFDHLTYIGFCIAPADTLLLVSTFDKTRTPETIATGHNTPDLIKIFNFQPTEYDGTIDHTFFSINNLFDLRMEFLSSVNPTESIPEIKLKYSATNFAGTERMQAAGRVIQWMDVYEFVERENKYEIANEKFREEFIPILDQLTTFYETALRAKRANQPILCEDDFKLLEERMKKAKQIVGI